MVLTDDRLRLDRRRGRGGPRGLRQHPQVRHLHLRPRHAGGRAVPALSRSPAARIPLPLTALQILAIDLGTETLPALALGPRAGRAGDHGPPAAPARARHHRPPDARRAPGCGSALLEAALVTGGFFFVLLRAGWSPGDAAGTGTPLHHDYLLATTMTFAGITACQVGTAFAARTDRASLRSIGVFSNPLLLCRHRLRAGLRRGADLPAAAAGASSTPPRSAPRAGAARHASR